jgi:hypothetical protein
LLSVEAVGAEVPRSGDGTLNVYKTDLEELTLRISAAVPDGMLDEVMTPSEARRRQVQVHLVCDSIESRRRFAHLLPGDGVHEATIEFRREDWAGVAKLQAFLVRLRHNPKQPLGFAGDKGSALAWSPPLSLIFDEPPPHGGKHLKTEWENFTESNDLWRRRHCEQLFALDTKTDVPTLYLNSAFPGARRVLENDAPHGGVARARDATYFMIVHQVWTGLMSTALTAISPYNMENSEMSADEKLAEIKGWQAGILREWSPLLYPELESDEALQRTVEAGGDLVNTFDLMGRVPNAIQARFSTHLGYQKLWEALSGD